MTETCRFTVLFTNQKAKKAKTWHDGILHVRNRTKLLFDSSGQLLETFHTLQQVVTGDQLESEKYLITVEDLIAADATSSSVPEGSSCPRLSFPVSDSSLQYGERGKACRGPKGFVPPRRMAVVVPSAGALDESSAYATPAPPVPVSQKRASIFTLYADTAAADGPSAGKYVAFDKPTFYHSPGDGNVAEDEDECPIRVPPSSRQPFVHHQALESSSLDRALVTGLPERRPPLQPATGSSAPKRTTSDILALLCGKKDPQTREAVDQRVHCSSDLDSSALENTRGLCTRPLPASHPIKPAVLRAGPAVPATCDSSFELLSSVGDTTTATFDLDLDETDDEGDGFRYGANVASSDAFDELGAAVVAAAAADSAHAPLPPFALTAAVDNEPASLGRLLLGGADASAAFNMSSAAAGFGTLTGLGSPLAAEHSPSKATAAAHSNHPVPMVPLGRPSQQPPTSVMNSESLLLHSSSQWRTSLVPPTALTEELRRAGCEGASLTPTASIRCGRQDTGRSLAPGNPATRATQLLASYRPLGSLAGSTVCRRSDAVSAAAVSSATSASSGSRNSDWDPRQQEKTRIYVYRDLYHRTLDHLDGVGWDGVTSLLAEQVVPQQLSKWDTFAVDDRLGAGSASVAASQRSLFDQSSNYGDQQLMPVSLSPPTRDGDRLVSDGDCELWPPAKTGAIAEELYRHCAPAVVEEEAGWHDTAGSSDQRVPSSFDRAEPMSHCCWKHATRRPPPSTPQLCFADGVEAGQPAPKRSTIIPECFASLAEYKCIMETALIEHLNIMLLELSAAYRAASQLVDITIGAAGDAWKPPGADVPNASTQPPVAETKCSHGAVCKLVQVKKDGPNKGRHFLACSYPRSSQCKFFKWVDGKQDMSKPSGRLDECVRKLESRESVNSYFVSKGVSLYCGCQFSRAPDLVAGNKRKFSATGNGQGRFFLYLSRRATSADYSKDDLWIVTLTLRFEPAQTAIARSVFFGPNTDGAVELEIINGCKVESWQNGASCHAIHVGNVATELRCIGIVRELNTLSIPIMPWLLCLRTSSRGHSLDRRQAFVGPSARSRLRLVVPWPSVVSEIDAFVDQYSLNRCQADALRSIAEMFHKDGSSGDKPCPIKLIQGVFGAGKSFLLAIIIMFLSKILEMNDECLGSSSACTADYSRSRILLSSLTNVAVDRVLTSLLSLGFEDFIRVGSLKKLNKAVLPYSIHASGGSSNELKELQEMLKSSEATPSEKQCIRKTIEKHKLGENKRKLAKVRVIGVTCAACDFPVLDDMRFAIVVLDECSQLTEPVSLLPLVRAHCEQLVLVGDPHQLNPSVQGSSCNHLQGLEQTMFDRLVLMGYQTIKLNIQYRCHPVISSVANNLFYGGQLIDGVTAELRPPLVPELGHLCFVDVTGGQQECTMEKNSLCNQKEAETAVCLVDMLLTYGLEPLSIGVITLYRSQVQLIRTALEGHSSADLDKVKAVQVSTVDAFQGGEKDVIILSCVRTDQMGFADDAKRTNVALTRAKHHLIIVGSRRNLSNNSLWSKVLDHCESLPGGVQRADTVQKRWAAMKARSQKPLAIGSTATVAAQRPAHGSVPDCGSLPKTKADFAGVNADDGLLSATGESHFVSDWGCAQDKQKSHQAGSMTPADDDKNGSSLPALPLCLSASSSCSSLPLELSDEEFSEGYLRLRTQQQQQHRRQESESDQCCPEPTLPV